MILYDIKGIPIQLGDLVRTNHFKDGTARGKQRYLYHAVMARDISGALEFVSFGEAIGGKPDGGCFWYLSAFQQMLYDEKAEVLCGKSWPWDREKCKEEIYVREDIKV